MTTIADKCREAGIAVPTYYFRIKQGMTPDEAVSRGLLRRGRKDNSAKLFYEGCKVIELLQPQAYRRFIYLRRKGCEHEAWQIVAQAWEKRQR